MEERLFQKKLIFEYLSKQPKSTSCSLCSRRMPIKDIVCRACFCRLHPFPADFKISIAVEYAKIFQIIRAKSLGKSKLLSKNEDECLKLLGISSRCPLQDLIGKILTLEPTGLSHEEILILNSIKLKIRASTVNEWTVVRIKSMMDLIDEQLNAINLRYLICLRHLRIDDALSLKKHIIEIKKHKDDLDTILKRKSIL